MTDYVLTMEAERTVLTADASSAPPVLLAVGRATIARDCFKQDPPSPLELEYAIAAIEDQIALTRTLPAKGSRLSTKDPLVREMSLASGLSGDPETIFTLVAVEQAFQRLAAQASRGLSSGDGVASGNQAAAALVILRELMHHMGFSAVVVQFPHPSTCG